jgi:OTU domain-containing protein 6
LLTKYETADNDTTTAAAAVAATTTTTTTTDEPHQQEEETEQQLFQRKKLARAEKKRQEAKERERAEQIALQEAQALPNAKQTELQQMQLPVYGMIVDVPADGHCLYRAIAAQLSLSTTTTTTDYRTVRNVAADGLLKHRDTLEAFCESHYDDYIDRVRNSADWGGHLELRALCFMLHRPIIIYSTNPPLTIGDDKDDHDHDNHGAQDQAAAVEPIRLSYHLHYYALGEHYNHVVIRPPANANPAGDERK